LVDAEIILQHLDIHGEKVIPARFEPSSISFICPGEEISENHSHDPGFGNTCIKYLLDDFRKCYRLNIHRIDTEPTKDPYTASRLKVCVYYRNNLGQYFESRYETYLNIIKITEGKILEDNETAELSQIYIPTRSKFYAYPISKEEINKSISFRNSKRDLCGW